MVNGKCNEKKNTEKHQSCTLPYGDIDERVEKTESPLLKLNVEQA